MVDTGRVGIVVRTKNRAWFLARALGDIAAQHYPDWRVHIVNDGGDASAVDAIVAELPDAVRDHVSVTHNPTPRGRSAAANQGVRALADTEFIVLHDDDDLWHPRFLAETVTWLEDHPGDIGVVARTAIVYESATADGGFEETAREIFWAEIDEITYTDLLEINRWVPIAYLYRRVLHDRVGLYDEDIHAAEDWDLGLRTLVRYRVGLLSGEPLAFWMQRRDVDGDLGNSMFALAAEHGRYDGIIRDRALRDYAAANGAGLALYMTKYIPDQVRRIVNEELTRELNARPSDMDRLRRRLSRLRRRKK